MTGFNVALPSMMSAFEKMQEDLRKPISGLKLKTIWISMKQSLMHLLTISPIFESISIGARIHAYTDFEDQTTKLYITVSAGYMF